MNTNSDSIKKFITCQSCHAILPICTGEIVEVDGQVKRICSKCFRELTSTKEHLLEIIHK